jgi:NADH-ubiquinone oxidoreductase chain 1
MIINIKNFFFLKLFLSIILFIIILIERSRIPFDFVEGESELVSGFNIEYSRSYFSLFFIYEYGIMLYFSILLRYFLIFFFFFFVLIYLFIHIRSSFPRLRYDQIMNIVWKYIYSLLISILILIKF